MAETHAVHSREMAEIRAGLQETRAIADSNARAIEAWSGRITESEDISRSMAASADQRLESAIADTVAMIVDLGQQQQETDQRFEVFLAETRADRQRFDQAKQETDQRFEVFLAEVRADRQCFDQALAANAVEHRAFTQNLQVLLAEISRLWQRLAG
jgi:hypothetical protein